MRPDKTNLCLLFRYGLIIYNIYMCLWCNSAFFKYHNLGFLLIATLTNLSKVDYEKNIISSTWKISKPFIPCVSG